MLGIPSQFNFNLVGILNDVIIGDHITFLVDDETRTQTGLLELSLGVFTEKFLKKIFKRIFSSMWASLKIPENGTAAFDGFHGTDVDDGRTGLFSQLAEIYRHHNDII